MTPEKLKKDLKLGFARLSDLRCLSHLHGWDQHTAEQKCLNGELTVQDLNAILNTPERKKLT